MAGELNWDAAKDALYDWIAAAVGVRVRYYGEDDDEEPTADVDNVTIAIPTVNPVGSGSQQIHYDASRDATHEGIELRSGGLLELVVQLSASSEAATGSSSATVLLARARARLLAESAERGALRAAGLTLSSIGPVLGLPRLEGTDFRGRAVVELRMYARDYASTFTTWIETMTTVATVED